MTNETKDETPVTGYAVNVEALIKRLEEERRAGRGLSVRDALSLAKAIQERLPDDLDGVSGDEDETDNLVDLCWAVDGLWQETDGAFCGRLIDEAEEIPCGRPAGHSGVHRAQPEPEDRREVTS